MINKSKIKYITSLQKKKFRQKYNKFIIEGHKTVLDVLNSEYIIDEIFTINENKYQDLFDEVNTKFIGISTDDMKKISSLKTASDILAVVNITPNKTYHKQDKGFTLCLADIQDPGNLGTIIRTANWFGITNIVCSLKTADLYNPKTIQATMGAFANMNIFYLDLEQYLQNQENTIYGAFLSGENIYNTDLEQNSIIVMGNEGNGIPENIEKLITKKLTIPSFAGDKLKAESLNVSTSTAIVLSEFKRRKN